MKKLIIALLALCLVGCSSSGYVSKITEGDKVLTSGDVSITKQGFYEYLLEHYGSSEVLAEIISAICDKEVTDQDAIDKKLKEQIELYEKYMGDLEEYAVEQGYKDKAEYVEKALLPDVKETLLKTNYINENLDQVVSDYQVCSLKEIVVEKESDALNIIKQATDEDKFDSLMEDNTTAEDMGVVTKSSSIDEKLLDNLETFIKETKDGVYSKPIALSTGEYAVVYLYNTDKKDKDSIVEKLLTIEDLGYVIEGYYFNKYECKVNEPKIKDAIDEISKEYLKK